MRFFAYCYIQYTILTLLTLLTLLTILLPMSHKSQHQGLYVLSFNNNNKKKIGGLKKKKTLGSIESMDIQ